MAEFKKGHLVMGGRMPKWRNAIVKLTDEQAQDILDHRPDLELFGFNYKQHGELMRKLAEKHRCSVGTVGRIWRRQAYSHLRRTGS